MWFEDTIRQSSLFSADKVCVQRVVLHEYFDFLLLEVQVTQWQRSFGIIMICELLLVEPTMNLLNMLALALFLIDRTRSFLICVVVLAI